MADIKFMDISENNNPATTDSILIGNKDNGLKRTSLGNLAAMFAVHGLLHFEQVNSVLKDGNTTNYPITAPDVSGYRFAFWLSPSTTGWVGSTYIDTPTSKNANIWIAYPDKGSDYLNASVNGSTSVSSIAVYVNNSIA